MRLGLPLLPARFRGAREVGRPGDLYGVSPGGSRRWDILRRGTREVASSHRVNLTRTMMFLRARPISNKTSPLWGSAMAIYRLIANGAFGPDEIEVMTSRMKTL